MDNGNMVPRQNFFHAKLGLYVCPMVNNRLPQGKQPTFGDTLQELTQPTSGPVTIRGLFIHGYWSEILVPRMPF